MSSYDEKHGDEGKGEGKSSFDWLPPNCTPLADGEYDAIIMGTGLTECIISGLLSVNGKKVLHVDRNGYYGADTASLSLINLYEKFRGGEAPASNLGHSRDWNVDLVPKFIMACGKLVKILLHSKVTRYLEFKSIDGSYVFKDNKILKVPATPAEALSSSLMGMFEKRRFRSFLVFLQNYQVDKPATWLKGKTLDKVTTRQMFEEYGLDANTQSFVGHAMALMPNDDYLDAPANITADALQLYIYSLEQHGKSPYIYPLYGLGGMPEGFSRLCAIHGGTFMLNTAVDEILMDGAGRAWGVKTGNEVAKAPMIIGDPSYFDSSKYRVTGKVVRSICFLDHPIKGTDNGESVQVIIPALQVGRKNDIYVCMVSFAHNISSAGTYVAIVSTTVETERPLKELDPGFALLGNIMERFDAVTDLLEPIGDGKADNCYISKSYDAASHFETCANDVLDLYTRITGEELDMNISADMNEDDES